MSSSHSQTALAPENLFCRKQLAFYRDPVQPRCLDDAARFPLAFRPKLFDWRDVLLIVKPDTVIRWHRVGFKLFWNWKSHADRPQAPQKCHASLFC